MLIYLPLSAETIFLMCTVACQKVVLQFRPKTCVSLHTFSSLVWPSVTVSLILRKHAVPLSISGLEILLELFLRIVAHVSERTFCNLLFFPWMSDPLCFFSGDKFSEIWWLFLWRIYVLPIVSTCQRMIWSTLCIELYWLYWLYWLRSAGAFGTRLTQPKLTGHSAAEQGIGSAEFGRCFPPLLVDYSSIASQDVHHQEQILDILKIASRNI